MTIDIIIYELEQIIADCMARNSRAGYFAVLYHRVTCRIKEGIQRNEFEDNERMERLDVLFAMRYIDAWKQWKASQQPSHSWKSAFDVVSEKQAIILQHLLLGINAHINLDLGIAAALTMKGYPLQDIHKDFNSINSILAALTEEVQDNLGKVSPLMILADRFAKGHDEMLANFSVQVAREGAWIFANELFSKTDADYDTCIAARDKRIALLGNTIARPKGKFFTLILKVIAFFEWRQPRDVISKMKYIVEEAAEKAT